MREKEGILSAEAGVHQHQRDKWSEQQKNYLGEFPCGLVVRIPGFHCCDAGSIPGGGTEIQQKKKKLFSNTQSEGEEKNQEKVSYGNPRPENVRTLTRRSNAVESQTEDWKAHFIYHLRGFGDLSENWHQSRGGVGWKVRWQGENIREQENRDSKRGREGIHWRGW